MDMEDLVTVHLRITLSGYYASACRNEAGPRGSWTEEQEREEKEREPITQDQRLHRGTALRHRERKQTLIQVDATNESIRIYIYKQIDEWSRRYNPRWAQKRCKRIASGKQRAGRRTDADACPLRHTEKGAGRRCCRTHSGDPRNSASLLETLHRKAMEQKIRERSVRNRFSSTSSSPREIPSSPSSSSFYRPRRSRSALTTYLPNLPT